MQITADKKVTKYVAKTGMLKGTRRLIAGVSGGADSVFLFYMMKRICAEQDIPFEVIHIHHGIRGEEADADAAFVETLCKEADISFHLIRRDVPQEALERKMTLEEAGRYARYDSFREAAGKVPGTRIALAHQKNDLAETLLFQLSRGSGLRGLAGIRPVRGIYIRPLLSVTRQEEEEWLSSNHISWRTDSTNLEDDAARNRIRHYVLPYLEQEINAQTVSHMADTARIAALASDFIEEEARKRYRIYASEAFLKEEKQTPAAAERTESGTAPGTAERAEAGSHGVVLRISDGLVRDEPEIMQEEVVRLAVSHTLRTLKDISGLHIRLILELFDRENGKYLNLPKGLIAKKVRGGILLGCTGRR